MKIKIVSFAVTIATLTCMAAAQSPLTKATAYFPLSLGNQWTYTVRELNKPSATSITWRIAQVDAAANSFSLWAKPPDGDEPFSISLAERGLSETDSERLFIKSELKIGDKWSNTETGLNNANKTDSFELLDAGKPCVAGGHSFDDCIVIKEVNESTNFISVTTYAKDIGPVKYVYFDLLHPTHIRSIMTIKSWKVEKAA